ncbi:hypothetical protein CI610_00747 [invertebrate metagenome]|uniref:SH3b domain-containing protein n=1 Tax=invertebrate metagenome TaxID=1711999 RepID=A0A2H9TAK0_9ZZZZ
MTESASIGRSLLSGVLRMCCHKFNPIKKTVIVNIIKNRLCFLLLGALLSVNVLAETLYVNDLNYIPMRSGPGNQYRIVHQGIKTGTPLTLLEANAGNNYSKVKTQGGLEGYMLKQYLMTERPARLLLPALESRLTDVSRENQQLKAQMDEQAAQLDETMEQLESVGQQLQKKTTELKEVKEISADAIAVKQHGQEVQVANKQLTEKVEQLEADNQRLRRDQYLMWFLYGAGAVLLGILAGVFLPRIRFRQKTSSEWV